MLPCRDVIPIDAALASCPLKTEWLANMVNFKDGHVGEDHSYEV